MSELQLGDTRIREDGKTVMAIQVLARPMKMQSVPIKR